MLYQEGPLGIVKTAVELHVLMVEHNVRFANERTKMDVVNIRTHIRIIHRLSLAVLDTKNPVDEHSASTTSRSPSPFMAGRIAERIKHTKMV